MAARAQKAGQPGAAATRGKSGGAGPAGAPIPVEQEIRELAYGYFVERGCVEGHDLDDWLRAEAQVQQRNGGAEPAGGPAAH